MIQADDFHRDAQLRKHLGGACCTRLQFQHVFYRLEFNSEIRNIFLEQIGALHNMDAFRFLLGVLRGEPDEQLKEAAGRGLRNLTGHDFGTDAGAWAAWRHSNPDFEPDR